MGTPACRIALTIAGSDSGGGAGIQSDLRTFEAFGCYGTSVVTAVTAQNTLGVRAVHPVPAEIVALQLQALADDLPPAACKSGMLGTAAVVETVAGAIAAYSWPYVLDPVIRSTSGTPLLDADGVTAMRDRLLPLAACVTPNLDEAAVLTGIAVYDADTMQLAAERLLELGASAALVTGGHLEGDVIVDVLVSANGVRRFPGRRIASRATHGTGCVLSAAITAGLADARPLEDAVANAIAWVRTVIANAPPIGAGRGPAWINAAHRGDSRSNPGDV
ncbi:MAG: bifunctional hydroxymethylpyrimidine kinase/phosphomethylpyrimidine kinase [Gemmatimonadales bacterium]